MKSHTTLLNQLIDALYAAPLSPEIHPYQILAAEIRGQMGTPTTDTKPQVSPISYVKEANEWVKNVSGEVTISDFKEWLQATHPNEQINLASLNSPVRKLVQAGKLKVLSTGSGRRPSVYKPL